MRISRKVRTAGVGLKSYLSSGMISASPRTSARVLSQVVLVGARKLVAGKPGRPAPAAGAGPLGVWAIPGAAHSRARAATTRLRISVSLLIIPPVRARDGGAGRQDRTLMSLGRR